MLHFGDHDSERTDLACWARDCFPYLNIYQKDLYFITLGCEGHISFLYSKSNFVCSKPYPTELAAILSSIKTNRFPTPGHVMVGLPWSSLWKLSISTSLCLIQAAMAPERFTVLLLARVQGSVPGSSFKEMPAAPRVEWPREFSLKNPAKPRLCQQSAGASVPILSQLQPPARVTCSSARDPLSQLPSKAQPARPSANSWLTGTIGNNKMMIVVLSHWVLGVISSATKRQRQLSVHAHETSSFPRDEIYIFKVQEIVYITCPILSKKK